MHATVVVPTFNEAANLPELVRRIHTALPDAEVLVVDDASPDGTAAVARDLAARFPVRVVERLGERGLATAALRGFREARTDICVSIDADLSHPPELLPAFVAAVEDGADVALASRYVPGGGIAHWTPFRKLLSRIGALVTRPLTPASDPGTGYFCLRRGMLDGLKLQPKGFRLLLEILVRTRPARIVEIPIVFGDRAGGASKFSLKVALAFAAQLVELYRDRFWSR